MKASKKITLAFASLVLATGALYHKNFPAKEIDTRSVVEVIPPAEAGQQVTTTSPTSPNVIQTPKIADTIPLATGQVLFRTVSKDYMLENFPILRDWIEFRDEISLPRIFPDQTKIATFHDEKNKTEYLVILHDTPEWCDGSGCALFVYANVNSSEYKMVHNVSALEPISLRLDGDTLSIITCVPGGHQQTWTGSTSGYDDPMNMKTFGHFAFAGKLDSPPPGLPSCPAPKVP